LYVSADDNMQFEVSEAADQIEPDPDHHVDHQVPFGDLEEVALAAETELGLDFDVDKVFRLNGVDDDDGDDVDVVGDPVVDGVEATLGIVVPSPMKFRSQNSEVSG
jgi:hypothetical protein